MTSKKILIIEDEPMIALLLEDFLDMLGHKTDGPYDSVDSGLAAVRTGGFDAAIMDINIEGGKAWDIAQTLSDKDIPFAISSGSGSTDIPQEFANAPRLAKPYMLIDVERVLENMFGN